MVQPKAEIDERIEQRRLGGVARWPLSLALLAATTFATVFLSRVSLGPSELDASFEHAVPLLGGLTVFLGASEVRIPFLVDFPIDGTFLLVHLRRERL